VEAAGWGQPALPGAEGFIVFADGFGVAVGDGVAVDGLERIRIFATAEFLAKPGAGVFERGDNAHFDERPLRGFAFALIHAAEFLGLGAGGGEALALFARIDELFDGAKAIGPVGETAAGERAAGGFGVAGGFAEAAGEAFEVGEGGFGGGGEVAGGAGRGVGGCRGGGRGCLLRVGRLVVGKL